MSDFIDAAWNDLYGSNSDIYSSWTSLLVMNAKSIDSDQTWYTSDPSPPTGDSVEDAVHIIQSSQPQALVQVPLRETADV
jgi:hypothetical protein